MEGMGSYFEVFSPLAVEDCSLELLAPAILSPKEAAKSMLDARAGKATPTIMKIDFCLTSTAESREHCHIYGGLNTRLVP